jgi:hypothetical protein
MLKQGGAGFPGGSSLVRLLKQRRGAKPRKGPHDLTVEQILSWADAYQAKHGRWPNVASGRVAAAPSEKWSNINGTLRKGGRGLPGGSSLGCVLAEHRGVPNRKSPPELSIVEILAWADAHHAAHDAWPTTDTGPVASVPGETWGSIDGALKKGTRGLAGGTSLSRLLDEHRTRGRLSAAARMKLASETIPL